MNRLIEPTKAMGLTSMCANRERNVRLVPSRRLAALFAVFICGQVGAGDNDPVRRPYVEVGDCWSYRADKMNYREPIGDYEECITFVDSEKNVILAVAKLKKDGREIDTSYSMEWEERIDIEGAIYSRTSSRAHRFPLIVGDEWTERLEFRRALLGPVQGKTTFRIKAVAWEEVAVPAGRFRALRLEASGHGERYDVPSEFSVTVTAWYAPEVCRYVKNLFRTSGGVRGYELTGYRLNK